MTPEVDLALFWVAYDTMGVYPRACNGVERTPYQDGWNAYGEEFLSTFIKTKDWFSALPEWKQVIVGDLVKNEAIMIQYPKEGARIFFNSSDLFAWGCADCEEITSDDMLRELYDIWKVKGDNGLSVWLCKKEGMQPQWPVEKDWRRLGIWDNELENLKPNYYDESIKRWKTSTAKAEAIRKIKDDPEQSSSNA